MDISIPKAAIQGLALGAFTKFSEPRAQVYVPMIGQRIPLYLIAGAGGVGASVMGDIVHSYVLPHIPTLKKYSVQESAILSPAINAGSYLGTFYLLNPDTIKTIGALQLVGEAVASDIGAHYVADSFF